MPAAIAVNPAVIPPVKSADREKMSHMLSKYGV
jgi:hypothetical protein